MTRVTDRRRFLQTTAAAGVGYWVASGAEAAASKSPNEQIQVGCIGVAGGKGGDDVNNMSLHGKIFALCDVDSSFLNGAARKYKVDHKFADYREMLDKMGDKI